MGKIVKDTRGDYLCGIKFWAEWRMDIYARPSFELFVYIGNEPANKLYYFASVKSPARVISKTWYQLSTNGFRPFCYDTERYMSYLAEAGQISPPPNSPKEPA